MTPRAPTVRTYSGAASAAGPLLFVRSTLRAQLGEWVQIEIEGQAERRGQVIDVGTDITVIQVFEDTLGLRPAKARITLTGETATTTVGKDLLGRALSGTGAPLDQLPIAIGEARRPIWGEPINPVRRRNPSDFIETGVSAIDGMNTLVRGQKLPVFSAPGLPGIELAADIVENARPARGEPFAVVFAAIGITERETQTFVSRFRESEVMQRTVLYLNQASDPTIERLLTPRVALTTAEHLAFVHGFHVLVVTADITHYAEALREIAAAREEIPGRRGYPGYMYTDLASLFERAGVLENGEGSVTQLPVVTLPDGDITHPIPDLTGYITEGQIVLNRELHQRGIYPPVDVLPSLSRLMNAGIGKTRTVPEHREWANQLYAVYARGREAKLMAAIVGTEGLASEDQHALEFTDLFEQRLIHQGRRRRSLEDTIEIGWSLLQTLPRDELTRMSETTWQAHAARDQDEEKPK
ncbi:MAG: V-type ATP synthase subunit B [Myxococcales bacterium]|nr:V-type ATP synthase subunit B [Myxococcales bacterium]